MWYIIALVVLFLILKFVIGYIIEHLATIAFIVIPPVILFLIIFIYERRQKKKQRYVNDDSNSDTYANIQSKPITQETTAVHQASITQESSVIQQRLDKPHPKYEVFHRNKDEFQDNMNYQLYRCRGIYVQTNRKRTLQIEAFDTDDVRKQLLEKGFTEPYEITRIPFPTITENQKAALGNMPFYDICQYDASALLSKKYDNDSTPNPELLSYATECRIKLSYYIGKKALYDLIFNSLELKDKIAFFLFCVYRYSTDDRQGNLHNSPYKDYFYQSAEEYLSNESFIKSMNRYRGQDLRFFGTLTVYNTQATGGSTNTIAYKTAIDHLKKDFTLSNIHSKTL